MVSVARATWAIGVMAAAYGGCNAARAADTDGQYLATNQIRLTFQAEGERDLLGAEVWLRDERSAEWRRVATEWDGGQSALVTIEEDGCYDVFLMLRNEAGGSAAEPGPETAGQACVVIDTAPPVLQVHAVRVVDRGEAGIELRAGLTAYEENHRAEWIRVFYQPETGGRWVDGGAGRVVDGELVWPVPRDVSGELRMRVVATDSAGNRAADEWSGRLPAAAPAGATGGGSKVEPLAVAPVEIAPVGKVVLDRPKQEEVGLDLADAQYLPHLRKLAARYEGEGRYGLAAARLEDALALAPEDTGLLVELGSALYRSGRYLEAGERFEAALRQQENHIEAIEGLALVEATLKRYPEARAQLQRALTLRPESGRNWLRYGDIEHRLGNREAALKAWRHVLMVDDADEAATGQARERLKYFEREAK